MDLETFYSILLFQNSLFNYSPKGKNISNLKVKYSFIIYCTEYNFLQNTINSIEKQIYNNYEIILIYDNNDKDELKKIQNLVNKYININLINNNEKRGIFYSYSSCILKVKGDYIFTIKSGYTLTTKNVLNDINNYIEKDNQIDILEFSLLNNKYDNINNNSLSLYKCEHYKSEINLDSLKFNEQYRPIDQEKELMVNKLIKASLYKDLINPLCILKVDVSIFELLIFLIGLIK